MLKSYKIYYLYQHILIAGMETTVTTQYHFVIGPRNLKSKLQNHNLIIQLEEIQGTGSALGTFSADSISEISGGLIETPEELQGLIVSSSTSGLLTITEQGNVLIKFKYDVGGKTKTKDIHLLLAHRQITLVEALQIQNQKLKAKTNKLENEVTQLKAKCQNLEEQVTNLKADSQTSKTQVATLQGSNSYVQSQINSLQSQLAVIQQKWPLVDAFFIGGYKYQLDRYWQMHVHSNAINYIWKHQNYHREISGIYMSQNHKNKKFILEDY